MAIDPLNTTIDEFIKRSKALIGKEISERESWNTTATQDAIRHFAYGISDDNPLWLDPLYTSKTHGGRQLAPPTFLTSVLYPHLHGEPMDVPLTNLIGDLEFQWHSPIFLGDTFRASAKITGIYESKDRGGRRLVYIISETCYWNQHDVIVGKALGTIVRYPLAENDLLLNRSIYQYTEEELKRIGEAQECEYRRGQDSWAPEDLEINQALPTLVRGPLTVGDLICWQAGIGPSYRPGALGYIDNLKAPHNAVKNPVTRWPVKYSQQHEDFLLASQRGMPAPFDNGVMRFAWISPMLTNWIGDTGTLKRLSIQILEPNLYGDTTWYRGEVVGKALNDQGVVLKVDVTGVNQLNITTTKGTAEVFVPLEQKKRSQAGIQRTRWISQAGPKEVMEKGLVHELFEAQAQKTPNSLALSCEEEGLTYEGLNHRANRLAAYLRSLGIGPEVSVGILMESSLDVIMAILAILKAGGAYIFLDPDYPDQRIAFMLKDAQVSVLLTQERFKAHFPDYTQTIVCLDSDKKSFSTRSCQNSDSLSSPENLAYFMYTSGSTNAPKRVGIAHASLYLYINSLKESFNVVPGDIYLQTASFAFSASTRQIFLPLCVGASLHLATTEQRKDSVLLYELISRKQITVWDTVPSAWRNCVETVFGCKRRQKASPIDNSLRLILLTGESLYKRTIQQWKAHLNDSISILNLYSQTESVGTISYFPLSQEWENTDQIPPLGRPLKGTTIHILDNRFHPVEVDELGQICVGGERMARGYLNRPDLTAERFVPDASGDFPGGRVHNTGDIARYLLDESIEWMGRNDQQVKLRGYRVELGEIEAVLSQHPEVEAVVVLCREDTPGEKQLVVYATIAQQGVLVADLRAYLKSLLPEYMVPGAFVILEQLPLTSNGKVDKQSLPAPELPDRTQDMIYVRPHSVLEKLLMEAWEEVLKVEGIGIHDNFFELGGHSLLATQVLARLRHILELDFPLRTLFEHPTIAQLASVIDMQLTNTFQDWPTDESANLPQNNS